MRQVVAHVDKIRPLRRNLIEIPKRPLETQVRWMLTLAKAVEDHDIYAFDALDCLVRQLVAVAYVRDAARTLGEKVSAAGKTGANTCKQLPLTDSLLISPGRS